MSTGSWEADRLEEKISEVVLNASQPGSHGIKGPKEIQGQIQLKEASRPEGLRLVLDAFKDISRNHPSR